MARGAVADHAVQRVDRLVARDARQPEERAPEQRRHHPVRRVLAQALQRRPGDPGRIQPLGVAPDDARDRAARPREVALDQRPPDRRDMGLQAPRRHQGRGEHRRDRHPAAPAGRSAPANAAGTTAAAITASAVSAPAAWRNPGPRSARFARPSSRPISAAEPGHRMADAAEHRVGPADRDVDGERQQHDERPVHRAAPRSGTAVHPESPSARSSAAAPPPPSGAKTSPSAAPVCAATRPSAPCRRPAASHGSRARPPAMAGVPLRRFGGERREPGQVGAPAAARQASTRSAMSAKSVSPGRSAAPGPRNPPTTASGGSGGSSASARASRGAQSSRPGSRIHQRVGRPLQAEAEPRQGLGPRGAPARAPRRRRPRPPGAPPSRTLPRRPPASTPRAPAARAAARRRPPGKAPPRAGARSAPRPANGPGTARLASRRAVTRNAAAGTVTSATGPSGPSRPCRNSPKCPATVLAQVRGVNAVGSWLGLARRAGGR